MDAQHKPVLVGPVVHYLLGTGGRRFIDCTAGGGGHIEELLERADWQIEVLAVEVDPDAVRHLRERFAGRSGVQVVEGDYRELGEVAGRARFQPVDGILADVGQSFDQLLTSERGFSYRLDGPLDMRYSPGRGVPASEIVNRWSKDQLSALFWEIGEERQAGRLADLILRSRPLTTTGELANVVGRVVRGPFRVKTLSRVFMALRVAANDELEAIRALASQALALLRPGGRFVTIAYDSHQDRIFKEAFRRLSRPAGKAEAVSDSAMNADWELTILTPHVIRPDRAEMAANPQARSARMRVVEKLRRA